MGRLVINFMGIVWNKFVQIYPTKKLIIYLTVGCFTNGIDVGLYWILTSRVGFYFLFSSLVSSAVSLFFNFTLHKFVTFKSKEYSRKQITRYLTLIALNYFFSAGLLAFLVKWLGADYLVAKLITLAGIITYNFLALKFWVFSKETLKYTTGFSRLREAVFSKLDVLMTTPQEIRINMNKIINRLHNLLSEIMNEENKIQYFTDEELLNEGKGFYYKGGKFNPHSDLGIKNNAFKRFYGKQVFFVFGILLLSILGFYLNWHSSLIVILSVLTILYFADLLFNLFLIFKALRSSPEIDVSDEEFFKSKINWPMYSVLCPLYKEWSVLPQFIKAIDNIDYPKEKLQVLLLLEEDDKETIQKLKEVSLPTAFEVFIVPHSVPKTKPKALNYGLQYVSGKYAVIYDAEDIPEPTQIKKAVIGFERLGKETICIQAKLNFYNPKQNLLTKFFTAEYYLWFNLILPGLQAINAPIPLGGTSNHFIVKDLIALKGWDAFNVTEDCDLGMRLVKNGFKTAIINSTTFEEANSNFTNWIHQRSRWIQGYIQTYLVHNRTTKEFAKDGGFLNIIIFNLVVGGKVLSIFINSIMWVLTIIYFLFRPIVGPFIESLFPGSILYIGVFSFIFGNFLYLYYYMIASARKGDFDLIKYLFLVPFYWLAMSFASPLAIYKIIFKPHYWSKTNHGLHLEKNDIDFNELTDEQIQKSPSVVYSDLTNTSRESKEIKNA